MIGAGFRSLILVGWVALLVIHLGQSGLAGDATGIESAIATQAGRQARYEAVWRGATVASLTQDVRGDDGRVTISQRISLTGPLPMLPIPGNLGQLTLTQELDHGLRLVGLRLEGTLLGEPVSGTAAIDHRGLRGAGRWGTHAAELADPDLRPETLAGCGLIAALPPGVRSGQRLAMPILVPRLGPGGVGLERRSTSITITAVADGWITARAEGDAGSTLRCLADGTLAEQHWPDADLTLHLVRLTAEDGTALPIRP